MHKSLEISIDKELEAVRKNTYEAADAAWVAPYSARSAARSAAAASAVDSAACSAWSLVDETGSYKEERLKQVEMIKEIL